MKQETVEQPASPAKDPEASRLRVILAVVIAAVFLDVVDFSVIQVALPTIQNEFGASLASAQWIIGVYGLTLAGFLMVSGRAGDVYGQKRIFVVGIIGFALSSLTAGFAPSLLILIVSRGIQGVAAAMTTATALAILAATFPEGEERNKAFGVLVAVLSAGFAAGPIPRGVLAAAAAVLRASEDGVRGEPPVDPHDGLRGRVPPPDRLPAGDAGILPVDHGPRVPAARRDLLLRWRLGGLAPRGPPGDEEGPHDFRGARDTGVVAPGADLPRGGLLRHPAGQRPVGPRGEHRVPRPCDGRPRGHETRRGGPRGRTHPDLPAARLSPR